MGKAKKFCDKATCDFNQEVENVAQIAYKLSPHRSIELFRRFLPMGYEMTTLSCVPRELHIPNLLAKICIGTIITLYDDLADHPHLRNSELLSDLYNIPFDSSLGRITQHHPMVDAIKHLWAVVFDYIVKFPHYELLQTAFKFDVMQFFNSNRYAEMISDYPFLFNEHESRSYLHHNMGMIIVGTIDLMCSPQLDVQSLGPARVIISKAQMAARMMNAIATYEREIHEGDVTNEIALSCSRAEVVSAMEGEIRDILLGLRSQKSSCFSVSEYVQGLERLFDLHNDFCGII